MLFFQIIYRIICHWIKKNIYVAFHWITPWLLFFSLNFIKTNSFVLFHHWSITEVHFLVNNLGRSNRKSSHRDDWGRGTQMPCQSHTKLAGITRDVTTTGFHLLRFCSVWACFPFLSFFSSEASEKTFQKRSLAWQTLWDDISVMLWPCDWESFLWHHTRWIQNLCFQHLKLVSEPSERETFNLVTGHLCVS